MLKRLGTQFSTMLLTMTMFVLVGSTTVWAASDGWYGDVSESNKHYTAIKELTEQDIFQGNAKGHFEPYRDLTRAQMALILDKSTNFEEPGDITETLEVYQDINSESRYAKEIATLTAAGVFEGDEKGNFNLYHKITRQQMASVLVLALDLDTLNDKKADKDVEINLDNVSDAHQARVQILANLHITDQTDDFRGYENISRAQVASFLYRAQNADEFELSVLHMNDTHGHAEELTHMVSAVKEQREVKPDSLLLHGGDVFSGTLYFTEHQGMADLQMLNLLNLDAMVYGNHEFDLGDKENGHKSLARFTKNAQFPLLNTNVDFSEDKFMDIFDTNKWNVENATGGDAYKSIIKEVNGEKIGIFGLTTEDTIDIASPVHVTFTDYIASAEKAVKEFEDAGIDKIISVNHLGYNSDPSVGNDILLAENVEGIDLIVGGHSHTALKEPQVVTEDAEGKEKEAPTVIVQAGEYAEYLGTVDVTFDLDGHISGYAGELIETADYEADVEAMEVLQPYKEEVDALAKKETGAVAEKPLDNPRQSEDSHDSVRANETELGNLVTDAMLAKAKEKKAFAETVIAFQNGGGIRAPIDQGPITVGEVINVLPFGNNPVSVSLKGNEIKEILEHSVRNAPNENGGFLHVSGMKFEFDSSREVGDRVLKMEVKKDDEFETINPEETYLVTTNGFTGQGGDGFDTFAKAFDDGRVSDMGESDWEQLRDYMVDDLDGKVNPEREGRIVDVAR